MDSRASSRFVRVSSQKARSVADLVRGKRVDQALAILGLTPRKASPILRKIIASAAANARHNAEGAVQPQDEQLYIKEIRVDVGPTMKRIRPRAQGRAYRILKRTSHIEVTVAPLS